MPKEVEGELQRAKRGGRDRGRRAAGAGCSSGLTSCGRSSRRTSPSFALTPELGSLEPAMRHALGGKRVRPVLCLATGDAVGARVENLLPAAAAVELVHSFSLVHDDLPALDDDRERRGAPSVWAHYGEATAILAGDALLAEAVRLALSAIRLPRWHGS